MFPVLYLVWSKLTLDAGLVFEILVHVHQGGNLNFCPVRTGVYGCQTKPHSLVTNRSVQHQDRGLVSELVFGVIEVVASDE